MFSIFIKNLSAQQMDVIFLDTLEVNARQMTILMDVTFTRLDQKILALEKSNLFLLLELDL